MQRISVIGVPGAGKTTLAREMAACLDLPHVELDAIYHQSNWQELAVAKFRAAVDELVAGHSWIIDGNYEAVRDLVWESADTVIWLDLPRRTTTRRVAARTIRRAATREVLWNGNREPLSNLWHPDPERNVIRWSWVKHPRYAQRFAAAMEDEQYRHLDFVRLRSGDDVSSFLARWSDMPH